MSTIIHWLSDGDLTSDGRARQVADLVTSDPALFPDLVAALDSPDPVVRGHGADALERVGRNHPEWALGDLPALRRQAVKDPVPMVRWHLAMLFGHMAGLDRARAANVRTLMRLLHDPSAFVRSWAVTSLCIIGRAGARQSADITRQISRLANDPSAAVRSRARRALEVLTHPNRPMPKGWVKSGST